MKVLFFVKIGGKVELKAVAPPRKGWDEAFKQMHERAGDKLPEYIALDEDMLEDWN